MLLSLNVHSIHLYGKTFLEETIFQSQQDLNQMLKTGRRAREPRQKERVADETLKSIYGDPIGVIVLVPEHVHSIG